MDDVKVTIDINLVCHITEEHDWGYSRVLRKVFEPKRKTVMGRSKKLLLPSRYYSGDQSNKNEAGGVCSTHGGRNAYRVLVCQPDELRPQRRPRPT
jgi:hypothetical protein